MTNYVSNLDIGQEIPGMPDGTNWTTAVQNTNPGSHVWYALAYDGTKFVALGYQGYISTSTDGTSWTAAVQNMNLGSHAWYALAYDGTKFVALGLGGYLSTSTDGTNWTAAVQNTNLGSYSWSALTYDGTKFVALDNGGSISTSTDGTNWTTAVQNTNLGANNWCALAYDGTKFVALGVYGHISTSTDGTNWTTAVQNTNLGSYSWSALTYDGTKFVALGNGGYISTSPNPTTTKIPIGGNNFDGQWVVNTHWLAEDVAWAATSAVTYSLEDILPDDGFDYLVAFSGYVTTNKAGNAGIQLMPGTQEYNTVCLYGCRMMYAEYHSSAAYTCSGNLILPIKSDDRNVTLAKTATTATQASGLYVLAYRRIGKNE